MLTSCTSTVDYFSPAWVVGAEASSLQPFTGTEPAGITGSEAAVHLLPVKLQGVDGRWSSEARLNMTLNNVFRKRKKGVLVRLHGGWQKTGDLMVVHQSLTFINVLKRW